MSLSGLTLTTSGGFAGRLLVNGAMARNNFTNWGNSMRPRMEIEYHTSSHYMTGRRPARMTRRRLTTDYPVFRSLRQIRTATSISEGAIMDHGGLWGSRDIALWGRHQYISQEWVLVQLWLRLYRNQSPT